jgi:hypothetical protein
MFIYLFFTSHIATDSARDKDCVALQTKRQQLSLFLGLRSLIEGKITRPNFFIG